MAGKGLTFFGLGTLFGALVSVTIATSWPTEAPASEASKADRKAAKGSRALHASKAGSSACPSPAGGVPWMGALASAATAANQTPAPQEEAQEAQEAEDELLDEGDLEAVEMIAVEAEWTPEMHAEYVAEQREDFERHQERIDEMRQDLVKQAGLNQDERRSFLALVDEVSETLREGDQKISALLAPGPSGAQGEDNLFNQEPPGTRRALLKSELDRTKALLDAQTRFEELLGEKRIKALGPGLGWVERFVKDEVWVEPAPLPDLGGSSDVIR